MANKMIHITIVKNLEILFEFRFIYPYIGKHGKVKISLLTNYRYSIIGLCSNQSTPAMVFKSSTV